MTGMRPRSPSRVQASGIAAVTLAAAWIATAPGRAQDSPIGSYPLDGIPRVLGRGAALPCATGLVRYEGRAVHLAQPGRVHPAFVAKLDGLDALVVATATEIYGRAPRTIVHLGTHACRRMRLYPDWVSEHALGNAIDVAGFDFSPLPRGATLPVSLPASLRRAFSVRMLDHWDATRGAGAVHARFLRTLAERLTARPDLFRVVLGPAWPGHRNHLHLDFAPYRVIEVF